MEENRGGTKHTPSTSPKQLHPASTREVPGSRRYRDGACPLCGQKTSDMHTPTLFLSHSPASQCGPGHRNTGTTLPGVAPESPVGFVPGEDFNLQGQQCEKGLQPQRSI